MNEIIINAQFEFPEVNKDESLEWNLQNMIQNLKITFPKKVKTNNRSKINISQYRSGYDEGYGYNNSDYSHE